LTWRNILEFLTQRKRDYGHTFFSPSGEAVLADLCTFCRGVESCWDPDPRKHALAEGRREVWLRIQNTLRLSPEQLYVLHSGGKFLPRDDQTQPDPDLGPINIG
jgi:hypothetical protein